MKENVNLYNAAIIGENSELGFIVDGSRLHAVELHVASLKKEKSDPELVLPLMRDALKALIKFAYGKVPTHVTEIDLKEISLKPNEHDQLIEKILHIFKHLSHQERNELSSLIHHKQGTAKKAR